MDKETKELRAIARFYKDSKMGFATNDGYYAIPSNGKSLAIVHNGEILKFCRTALTPFYLSDGIDKL